MGAQRTQHSQSLGVGVRVQPGARRLPSPWKLTGRGCLSYIFVIYLKKIKGNFYSVTEHMHL